MSFSAKLAEAQRSADSLVCVGLDPDPDRMPSHLTAGSLVEDAVMQFNTAIIEATLDVACAYKLNLAFYEALGSAGHRVLTHTLKQIPDGKITIADAKRGDIGNSARMYSRALFEELGCDACTVAPYMGRDAVEPFLQYPGRAAFVLARTSNPGGQDFQERLIDGKPLYLHVAQKVAQWAADAPGTAGLVVGATSVEPIEQIRHTCPDLPFLLPGVGAQGGDPAATVQTAGQNNAPILINSSRSIIYASTRKNFAEAARQAAQQLRRTLQKSKG